MSFRDLQEFLAKLEEGGDLHRVSVEVDPLLEIAEITSRISKRPGGKALLFERVKGSPFPVVTNLFGSPRRLSTALGIRSLNDLSRAMERLLSPVATVADLGSSPLLAPFSPRTVTTGISQEVEETPPDLSRWPLLKNWPGDGRTASAGRCISLPVVVTADPGTGSVNCGMYRVEMFGPDAAGIHWRRGSGGAGHYAKAALRGERLPVAIVIGADPALTFAATLPLPPTVDEMTLAGYLRGAPLEVVRCRTNPLLVPACAEGVIEGYVVPGEEVAGGAFGNHTGAYVAAGTVPLLHVTAITRRRECVYPATVIGPPPMEDCFLAKAAERFFLPLLRREIPGIVDINMPLEGIFHGCAIISVDRETEASPRQVLERLRRGSWLKDSRLIILVDARVDVQDLSLVAWQVINNVAWSRDLVITPPETREGGPLVGERAAIDATGIGGRKEIAMNTELKELVDRRWSAYGLEKPAERRRAAGKEEV